ncbi:MAG: hypothetical protein EOM21_19620, partial [Gammaproteobacteria bacterium]|nr:hypothetical protein [Gammaproteobacteria bacterium]
MAVLYVPHFVQFFDNNGDPLAGGKLYTYAAGTTTPKATYTTAAGDVANTNPVVLDASGRAVLFIDGAYRFDLFTSADVLVKSTDNVTNFTTTGTASNAYFQSFSGDGATVAFTASEDLGTDEKLIFVFADLEYATNGAFASDTGWTKGAGWSIGSGVATAAGAISTALEQTAGKALIAGELYRVSMTVTRDAGTITPNLGGTAGTGRSSAGTYHENIIAGATQIISFTTSGFTGTIDNVSVTKVSGQEILKTSDYTIDGTTLTLTVPPTTGTNNVQVWAPTKLANAASASASAAATSEANAATSETNAATSETNAGTSETNAAASALAAAASAAKLSGTSTTSLAIGTGSKAFTTQADKFFDVGAWLLITSDADPANYMHGQVTAYSGTSLTVNVTNVGGSGTLDDWTIRVAGTRGATGATGASGGPLSDGDYGDIVVSGTGTVMTLDIAGAT